MFGSKSVGPCRLCKYCYRLRDGDGNYTNVVDRGTCRFNPATAASWPIVTIWDGCREQRPDVCELVLVPYKPFRGSEA